jgi:hypothetical protein
VEIAAEVDTLQLNVEAPNARLATEHLAAGSRQLGVEDRSQCNARWQRRYGVALGLQTWG